MLLYDTTYDNFLHRQGVLILILLPQVVAVVRLTLSMLPGYPDYESRGVIEGDVLSHDEHCFSNLSTLNRKLASPVSRCHR
jgi:hypothetical protein